MDERSKARRTGRRFGLYGPDSEAWRLNREATLLLAAGPRALLLQLAHPLVAEGVAQHSRFREDPWSRLNETLKSYLRIVYGSEAAANAEIGRLNRLHARVTGPVEDPDAHARLGAKRYAARDPALSLWVHATLVDSTMVAYDAWIEPLSAERQARFYEETRRIGRAFGIPDETLPADLAAFRAYFDTMLSPSGPVHPTPTARDLARTILHPPLGPSLRPLGGGPVVRAASSLLDAVPAPLYDWTMWPAVALLPPGTRAEYGLEESLGRSVVAAWLVTAFRFWRPLLPRRIRQMPQALAADGRIESTPSV